MTRRAAAGFGRLLPLLLIAAAVVVFTGAALLAACGISTGGSTPQPTASTTSPPPASGSAQPTVSPSASPTAAAPTTLRLYFLRDGELGVAERRVPHTTAPATASLEALLAGPSGDELQAGLSTAIPPGTRLLSLSIGNGVAQVDLSRRFAGNGSAESLGRRAAEVVYTLTRFPTVRRVALTVDGAPFSPTGTAGSGAKEWGRSDLVRFEPAIFVEQPGVGAVLTSPFVLSGTATVFEGSFQARLVDTSGRRIVRVVVQASRGAPGRGRFSKVVPFSTSASAGTLVVYDLSMENGSHRNEVKVPVTFAAP